MDDIRMEHSQFCLLLKDEATIWQVLIFRSLYSLMQREFIDKSYEDIIDRKQVSFVQFSFHFLKLDLHQYTTLSAKSMIAAHMKIYVVHTWTCAQEYRKANKVLCC